MKIPKLCRLLLFAAVRSCSLLFDPANSQRVEVPGFSALGISTEVTVEFWALSTTAKDLFKNDIVEDRKRIQRLNENHDVQLAAAYFPQDVQSIGVRDAAARLVGGPAAELCLLVDVESTH